jgi:hypothetical protein
MMFNHQAQGTKLSKNAGIYHYAAHQRVSI